MSMTVNDIILRVRDQLYDVGAAKRWSDAAFYPLVGGALRKLAELRPEAVTLFGSLAVIPGPKQTAPAQFAHRVVEIVRNGDDVVWGDPIRQVERDVLDTFYAAWPSVESAALTVEQRYSVYALDPADPIGFWLFPAGVDGDSVVAKVVTLFPDPTDNADPLFVADQYASAIVDYITHVGLLSEAGGKDSKESQRYLNQFLISIGQERMVQAGVGQEAARPPEANA